MSRLAAVANALYFPTPLELVEPLMRHIRFIGYDRTKGVLLDPTCGEGLFAQALAAALQERYPAPANTTQRWRTYGIELDAARAAEARTRLDYCLCAPLEQTVIQGQADILFLNPPYDEVGGERIELRFLRLALPSLRENGLAIFVLPDHYVGEGKMVKPFVALLRRYGFDKLKVLRFPDPHYAPFRQHVILGVKGRPDNWQAQYGQYDLSVQGVLGDFTLTPDQEAEFFERPRRRYVELPDQILSLYANNQGQTLTIVKTALAEREGCFTEADLRKLYRFLGEPTDRPATFRPLAPISDLHAAAVVAAGYLDGVAVAGKVLRGSTFKRTISRRGFVDGVETEINAEISVTQLSILDEATGELTIINSEDHDAEFDRFMISNVRVLVDTIKRLFPAIFIDEKFAAWQGELAQVKGPRALRGHSNGMFLPQARVAAAMLTHWRKVGKIGVIVGEMSTGKTVQSLAAGAVWAAHHRSQKLVIVLPAKEDLAVKWREEALTALRFFGQHGPRVTYAKTITDLQQAMDADGFGIILLKETTAKLSSGWQSVTVPRRRNGWASQSGWELKAHAESWARAHDIDLQEVIQRKRDGRWNIVRTETVPACPSCGQDLLSVEDFELHPGRQQACPRCGGPLWSYVPRESGKTGHATTFGAWSAAVEQLTDANPDGPARKWALRRDAQGRRYWDPVSLVKASRTEWQKSLATCRISGRRGGGSYPLARFLRTHYARRYGLIIDEAHKLKGADTAVGYAANDLLSGCKAGLIMTGTIFNGAASSIFYLLYRSQPWFRQMFEHNDVQRFIDRYGLMQQITRWVPCSRSDSASGYRKIEGQPSERPGVAPGMVVHLLKCAAFIKLADLGFPMPAYKESTLFVDMDPEHAQVYDPFMEQCRQAAAAAAELGDYSPRGEYQVARWGILDVPLTPDVVAGVRWPTPKTPKSGLFRKEEAFLRLVGREKQAGRKVLCFVAQIKRRDPTPRLIELLQRYGMKGVTLYSDEKSRKEFIVRELANGADVIFCSPGILDVGIDLDMFQTAIWFGLEWNALVVAQANRRLWRLTQTQPVEIVYLAYNETKQAEGFDRVATRLAAMQALQGDIRAGLAQLRGERDFLAELQEAVDDSWRGKRLDSTYTLADLPPLKVFGKPQVPVIEELLWEPVLVAQTGQLGFGW